MGRSIKFGRDLIVRSTFAVYPDATITKVLGGDSGRVGLQITPYWGVGSQGHYLWILPDNSIDVPAICIVTSFDGHVYLDVEKYGSQIFQSVYVRPNGEAMRISITEFVLNAPAE